MRDSSLYRTLLTSAILFLGFLPGPSSFAQGQVVPSFAAARSFTVGRGPTFVTAGDLNGDGIPDLSVANSAYSGGLADVSVLLGNGDGAFRSVDRYTTGKNPRSVALGDLDGDGRIDMVVANAGSTNVSVLLGAGGGAFRPGDNLGVTGKPQSVTIADFNQDGRLDLGVVFTSFLSTGGSVAVFLGRGDGTFQGAGTYAGGRSPMHIINDDCNRDGKLDLIVADAYDDPPHVLVLLGKGDGSFEGAQAYYETQSPRCVALGDLNGDGWPDLCVAGPGSSNILVRLGKVDGTFDVSRSYLADRDPSSLALGDLNGDGKLDVFVTAPSSLSILLGNGDGTFAPVSRFNGVRDPVWVSLVDCNRDGKLDAVIADDESGTVSVLLGKGDGTFLSALRQFSGGGSINSVNSVVAGDFDRDARTDLVVANYYSGRVSVLLGMGDGRFRSPTSYFVGNTYPNSIAVGDFDGDQFPDLAVANRQSVEILGGNGDGTFRSANPVLGGVDPMAVVAADFNADGVLDLGVGNQDTRSIFVLSGSGDGTFQTSGSFGSAYVIGQPVLGVADFNRDGAADMVSILDPSAQTNGVFVLLGDGGGGFLSPVTTLGVFPDSIAFPVVDLNADGKPDLIVSQGTTVGVLMGNGDGSFRPPAEFAAGIKPQMGTIADFDGDGWYDLAVRNFQTASVTVLLGRGDGTFQAPVEFSVGAVPVTLAVADLNGDGKPDLITGNDGASISVLLNTWDFSAASLSLIRRNVDVVISWRASETEWFLESSEDLGSTNWATIHDASLGSSGRWEITVSPDQAQRYFRLRRL